MISSAKVIDWDYILDSYGVETKVALLKLIAQAEIQEDDPAAVVLAGLFISQIDSNKAFASLTSVIDQGKTELREQFEEQVLRLRGVISYAEEHLVEGGKQEIEKREKELLEVVKKGISKAIGNHNKNVSIRSTSHLLGTVIATFIVSILSLSAGGVGVYMMRPNPSPGATVISKLSPDNQALIEWAHTPKGKTWLSIVEHNDKMLDSCIDNRAELKNRCAMKIP